MNRNRFAYRASSERMRNQLSGLSEALDIGNATFIWDRPGMHLIVMVETNQTLGREIKALLKGDSLILESPLDLPIDRPIRSHLIGRESGHEFEDALINIRFTEIKLSPGYQYSILSSKVMDRNLIKIILAYKPSEKNMKN
jgi:hypothetical protein